jgi:hypothetical protein
VNEGASGSIDHHVQAQSVDHRRDPKCRGPEAELSECFGMQVKQDSSVLDCLCAYSSSPVELQSPSKLHKGRRRSSESLRYDTRRRRIPGFQETLDHTRADSMLAKKDVKRLAGVLGGTMRDILSLFAILSFFHLSRDSPLISLFLLDHREETIVSRHIY